MAFREHHADTALHGPAINFKNVQTLGDQISTNAPYLSSQQLFFYSCLISWCLWAVSSPNKTYPVARLSPSPLLDKQMVSQPDLQLSDQRQLCCWNRQKKKKKKKMKKKWATIIQLIAETVWSEADTFSRGEMLFSTNGDLI